MTVSVIGLFSFGLLFGVLVSALFVYQTQNLMKGVTSTERMRRARLTMQQHSQSNNTFAMENSRDGMALTEDDEDKLSQAVGLKSIRTEKYDPVYRQATQHAHFDEYEPEASCLSNCYKMLFDSQQTPEQLELFLAYQAPNRFTATQGGQGSESGAHGGAATGTTSPAKSKPDLTEKFI